MGFPVPGGSCLVSYRIDDTGADRKMIAHGYIREFHLGAAVIESQLKQMFRNGQRRLGICVPYYPGDDTFALDSTDGKLTAQDHANLLELVQMSARLGFDEYLVEMIPEWSASYANWLNPIVMQGEGVRAFQPLDYDRDFEFTMAVDRLMQSTGVQYRMDLIGEGADIGVCRRFWSDWCDQKDGHAGSVGFSMVPAQSSIDNYSQIYTNGIVPEVLSVHAYNSPDEMSWSQWKSATASWSQAYIIGESLCDNAGADAIFAGSPDRYYYRLVWPLGTNDPNNPTQDRLTVNQKF